MRAWLPLGVASIATVLVYWIGLHGPFLLDDLSNLEPVRAWLVGDASWQQVLLDNRSGAGRVVSLASFMLSAWLGGFQPFAFKLGNLVVHLACGVLGWQVLRQAMRRDPALAPNANLVASLLAGLWLLHPLNASTVLYAVQRMAQLSALFTLASVSTYLYARQALADGRAARGAACMFLLFPLLVVVGMLGKENAAVAPLLCLVMELGYFQRQRRPHSVRAFFLLFLAVPALAIAAWLLLQPGSLLGSYASRDFTLTERLLSEPRALLDYIGQLLFPRAPRLGVFTDDFPASTGLLSPPATLVSILVLAGTTAFAAGMRRRAPSVFVGWFFFLGAHAIESTILPLELYFEHRNYLPAFGLLLAVAGLAELATRNLQTNVLGRRQLGLLVACGFLLVFAFGTHGRARVWQSEQAIYEQALQAHPASFRATMGFAALGLRTGNMPMAYFAVDRLLASDNPRHRLLARVSRVMYRCIDHSGASPDDLREAVKLAQDKVTFHEMHAFELIEGLGPEVDCGVVGPGMIADSIDGIVDAATAQPDAAPGKWHLRLVAARLYGRAGRWKDAQSQAELAWQPGADPAAGGFLSRAYAHNGRMADAERIYADVQARTNPDNRGDMAGLAELRGFLDASRRTDGPAVQQAGSASSPSE